MIYWRYLWSLLRHKWYFLKSSRLLCVPFWRAILHDWSKFTPSEFGRYARWHFRGKENRLEWAAAWHHHQRLNAHHHEFYLLAWYGEDADFYDGIGEEVSDFVVVLPMPELHVREMIADLMAAGRVYAGTWDIALWFNENGPKMRLHSETADRIVDVMHELGYCLTDNCDWSWMAGDKFREWAKEHI
jgi:hypothetical protein